MIICYTVLEIWHMTDVIVVYICVPKIMIRWFTLVYHKWCLYDAWFLKYQAQLTEFLLTLDFLPFYPPPPPLTTQRIKIFKKWKKPWRYYHFTQVYYKWQSDDIWFLRYQLQGTDVFLTPWGVFCPSLTAQKMKISKKWKKKDWWYRQFTQVHQKSWS